MRMCSLDLDSELLRHDLVYRSLRLYCLILENLVERLGWTGGLSISSLRHCIGPALSILPHGWVGI